MNNGLNNTEKLTIRKLILMETGTYNPFFQRPWESHFDQGTVDNFTDRLSEMGASSIKKVTPEIFTGLSSNFMHPSTSPQKMIHMPSGWDEKRLRFLLEVEVVDTIGAGTIYYFQGYSDYHGVGVQKGSIDPEMIFIINSFIRVNRFNVTSTHGAGVKDVITESAQIINGAIYQDNTDDVNFKMRPSDVFTGMHSAHLQNNYEDKDSVYDSRIALQASDSIRSNRSNNIASRYLSTIINAHRYATDEYDGFGQESNTIFEQSGARSYEDSPNHNIFLRALSHLAGRVNVTTFRLNDLIKIDSNTVNVTHHMALNANAKSRLPKMGESANWNSRDNETVMASILINSIPAFMADNFLVGVHIRSTNYEGSIMTQVIDYNSFVNTDMSRYIEKFVDSIERQVINDITYNNQISYMLEMKVDLLGTTIVSISQNGNPEVVYTVPSFCDSLLSPIITSNQETFYNLTNDVEHLLNTIQESSFGRDNLISSARSNYTDSLI